MNLPELQLLRPWLLAALLPGLLLAWWLWRRQGSGAWLNLIDASLLAPLLPAAGGLRRGSLALGFALAWLLCTLALAGPSWSRLPQPLHRAGDALVLIADMSPSMLAQDLAPSRLERSRRKLQDILRTREDGLTALIAYGGDAHVVTPLTDDTATILALLPALAPDVMPRRGSNPADAVRLARELVSGAGLERARLLLITDGVSAAAADELRRAFAGSGLSLQILGVGTPQGAPIPRPDGGFERDAQGGIVVARLDEARLARLAADHGGRYRRVTVGDEDLEALLDRPLAAQAQFRESQRRFDLWRDDGAWLLLLALPLAALAFRRGWLLGLLVLCLPPQAAQAFEWQDLWHTRDQQGAAALAAGDPERAAQLFESPAWRGSAWYRYGDYDAAVAAFAEADDAAAHYNRGNALARGGHLEQALAAYDAALERAPGFADAAHNRALVEDLLRRQQEQEQEQPSPRHDDAPQEQQGSTPQPDSDSTDDPAGQVPRGSDPQRPPDKAGQPQPDNNTKPAAGGEPQPAGEPTQTGDNETTDGDGLAAIEREALQVEQQQALEQWLRRIPDDPAGLLRRKFRYESEQRPDGDVQEGW